MFHVREYEREINRWFACILTLKTMWLYLLKIKLNSFFHESFTDFFRHIRNHHSSCCAWYSTSREIQCTSFFCVSFRWFWTPFIHIFSRDTWLYRSYARSRPWGWCVGIWRYHISVLFCSSTFAKDRIKSWRTHPYNSWTRTRKCKKIN